MPAVAERRRTRARQDRIDGPRCIGHLVKGKKIERDLF